MIPMYYLLRTNDLEKTLVKSLLASGPTVDRSPRTTTVFVCLHLPSNQPMTQLTKLISELAKGLDADWDYRFAAGDDRGAFHITVKEPRS